MTHDPIHIIATVIKIQRVSNIPGNHKRQQILVSTDNGKHKFRIALNLWDAKINTVEVGNTYKFFISSEPSITENGFYINNLAAYKIINQ